MRRLAEGITASLQASGLFRLLESLEHNTRRLRVLTYHRVAELDEEPDLEPGLISATPAAFRQEMILLTERYTPVSLQQVLDAHSGNGDLPERAVLVTFDDGYQDFAEHAWPIMRAYDVPVVLFVPTAFPDGNPQGFWWDRLYAALFRTDRTELSAPDGSVLPLDDAHLRRQAYKKLRGHVKSLPHRQAMTWVDDQIADLADIPPLNRVLSWESLRQLAEEGVSLCSHSREHALLTRLSPEELREELTSSQAKLNTELGALAAPPTLAYPANAADESVHRAAADAGYIVSFGGARGLNRLPLENAQELRRMPVLRYQMGLYRAQLRPSLSAVGGALATLRGRIRT